jgi:hypothetical protein
VRSMILYQSSFPYTRAKELNFICHPLCCFTGPALQGCGPCQSTGSFNTCYYNTDAYPYNTAFVATFIVCGSVATTIEQRADEIFGMEKQPVSPVQAAAPSECKNTRQANRLTAANGKSYNITGPGRDVLVEDAINMEAGEFEAKWAHLRMETPLHVLQRINRTSGAAGEKK